MRACHALFEGDVPKIDVGGVAEKRQESHFFRPVESDPHFFQGVAQLAVVVPVETVADGEAITHWEARSLRVAWPYL